MGKLKVASFLTGSFLRSLTLCGLGAALAFINPAAHALPTTYSGSDTDAGPGDPHPNSDLAAANFDSAADPEALHTFEHQTVGSFSSLDLGSNLTVTGTDSFGNEQSIQDTPQYPAQPSIAGYNTTVGGSNYLNVLGGTVTFSFSTPINDFGAYFTGVQTEYGSVTLVSSTAAPRS